MRAFLRPSTSILQLSKKLSADRTTSSVHTWLSASRKCSTVNVGSLTKGLKYGSPRVTAVWNVSQRLWSSDASYSEPATATATSSTSAASPPAPPPVEEKPQKAASSVTSTQKVDVGEDFDYSTLGARQEKIDIDGMLINWDMLGTGDHVVLLLPGIIGCIKHDFIPIFKKMDKKKYTLVSWDPPGYGLSRPPERDFSGVFYRRDGHTVVKLMDKLGFDKFSILGWSNGGITGGHIAADYPSRVKHLVTWGAHAYADDRAVIFTQIMGDLDVWSPKMLEPAIAMYGKECLLKLMRDWHQAVSDFQKDGLDAEFKEGLGRITCPSLIIHGEEDPVLGVEHAEFMRDNIANARMWIMPKGKHNMHLRYTDEFLKEVTKFLET